MELTIGEIIGIDIKKKGLSVTHVAQRIGMSRKGLTDILKKNDMSLSQIASLSEELGRDYLEVFKQREKYNIPETIPNKINSSNEEAISYQKETSKNEMTFTLNISGEFDNIVKEIPELLALIKKEAEQRGFKLA